MPRYLQYFVAIVLASWASSTMLPSASAGELRAGAASISITPDQPVALAGQMMTRVARSAKTEIIAAALALETQDDSAQGDQAIFVACDLVYIPRGLIETVREKLRDRIPDFEASKLILSATHTHTAPVLYEGQYHMPSSDIMRPRDYVAFLADRVADVATEAWTRRASARVGWGLGHAVVGQNRRSVYADGRAQMYGPTNLPDFRGIEGPEDHGVEVLFVWDADDQLIATAVNLACPSQEVEGESEIHADFWSPVRAALRAKHGEELCVLGWTGASGDQSPHLMYRKAAEERMRRLRKLDRLDEITRRVVAAWDDALAGAEQERHADAPFEHVIESVELPRRIVTTEESDVARTTVAELSTDPKQQRRVHWTQAVVDRYDRQQTGESSPYVMELHVVRLGDITIATNDFEYFTQFGIQIKSRAAALQTFLIQLAGPGSYVPTEIAAAGGGYSAIVESNEVGAEGGQVLVERTVEAINRLWEE